MIENRSLLKVCVQHIGDSQGFPKTSVRIQELWEKTGYIPRIGDCLCCDDPINVDDTLSQPDQKYLTVVDTFLPEKSQEPGMMIIPGTHVLILNVTQQPVSLPFVYADRIYNGTDNQQLSLKHIYNGGS